MLKKYAIIVGKLGLSVAIVWGIAWGIVTFNVEGEVDESGALIWDMSGFERSNTQKFASALKSLGHEPPRVYNYNGNDVYVSTRKTEKEPRRAVRDYQRTFVRKGLNEEVYDWMPPTKENLEKGIDNPRTQKRYEAMLSGQIIPQWVGDDYASMGGGLIKGQPETRKELDQQIIQAKGTEELGETIDELEETFEACGYGENIDADSLVSSNAIPARASSSGKQCGGPRQPDAPAKAKRAATLKRMMSIASNHKSIFTDCPEFQNFLAGLKREEQEKFNQKVFESFRSIEMFKPQSGGNTTVTAIWGDAGFDIDKALEEAPDDPKIPACPSCEHGFRYSSKPNSQSYVTNVYRSPKRPERLEQYYLDEMRSRGWTRTDSNIQLERVMRHVDGKFETSHHLGLKRQDEYMMLNFREKPDGSTAITTMETRRPRTGTPSYED